MFYNNNFILINLTLCQKLLLPSTILKNDTLDTGFFSSSNITSFTLIYSNFEIYISSSLVNNTPRVKEMIFLCLPNGHLA